MQVDPEWLLPTDDPRVRRNRAEVLAFTTLTEAAPPSEPATPELAPPRAGPPELAEASPPPAPARRPPPAVDPARVQALLDAAPGAGPLPRDPAGTRQALLDLHAELDQMARRFFAGGGSGS